MMHSDFSRLKCIGSISDSRIAFIRSLSKRKDSGESGCFFLEGERAVSEVPDERGRVKTLVLSSSFISAIEEDSPGREIAARIARSGAEVIAVSDKVFGALSETRTPQGIAAVVVKPEVPEYELFLMNARRVLILENLQDPGNVGTCIRTADAFGMDGVILTDNCADVYNQKVLRSTVGSLFHTPVIQYRYGIFKLSVMMKENGMMVFGADPRGGVSSCSFRNGVEKCGIIIGNEANGLSDRARAVSDQLVTIPMPGRAESLNASIAAAVLMYELSK